MANFQVKVLEVKNFPAVKATATEPAKQEGNSYKLALKREGSIAGGFIAWLTVNASDTVYTVGQEMKIDSEIYTLKEVETASGQIIKKLVDKGF